VRRIYGSQYAHQIGIQLFFDDLAGEALSNATALERTLTDVREVDSKITIALAIGRFFRYLREVLERPRIEISGTVWVQPSAARASASLSDLTTGQEIYIDGSSSDFAALPMSSFVVSKLVSAIPLAPTVSPSGRAEELRQLSFQLQALALVLVCMMRFRESQTIRGGRRPGRWQTICLTAAALKDLV